MRVVNAKGRSFAHVYTDAKTAGYEKDLGTLAAVAMKGRAPLDGALGVRIFAMMPIPKSWPRRDRDAALAGTLLPTGKPDNDNIGKMIDALNGVVWLDDSQVCRTLIVREYADRPGLIIEVFKLS